MKLRTAVIDDEPIALEKLCNYVGKVPFLELAGAYQSSTEAVSEIVKNPVDLVITDIRMPDLNGMELVNSISNPPLIIFTTAYSEYAVESYRLAAVDYLLKPYSFADFQRAVGKALERIRPTLPTDPQRTNNQAGDNSAMSLFVKVDYRYIRVNLSSIKYIKGFGEYLQIWTDTSPTPYVTLSSFSAIIDRLTPNFLQLHRSYIVNMDKVEQISKNRIMIDADTLIPVSDSYKAMLTAYLQKHSVGSSGRKSE